MQEKTNKPSIRFKGFTDAWEQRKFKESFKLSQGLQVPIESQLENQTDNTERFIRIIDVTQKSEPPRYVYNPTGKGRVFKEDLFFVRYGAVGTIGYGFSGVIANNLFKLEPLNNEYNAFLYHQFVGTNFNKKLKEMSASTSMPAINFGALKNLLFYNTEYREQIKIGVFFQTLDALITLHQRKCETLKSLKKAMLEKLFPAEGSTVPEIRFKGFTDAWEQRKFEKMFDCLPNNSLSRSELSDDFGEVCNVHYGDVLIKYGEVLNCNSDSIPKVINTNKIKNLQASLLQDGDIIIADAAEDETVGKCSEIRNTTNKKVVSGLHTIPVRPNNIYAKGFLAYYMNSPAYHDQLLPLMQGTKVSSLSKTALQDTLLVIPNNKEEQLKIGSIFLSLDNLITLHQRKVEKLKNIKNSLLEKMFV